MPKIPPRPAGRRPDRSISPSRESFAQSPLNETPFSANLAKTSSHDGHSSRPNVDQPARPPSVVLPSIGQEGTEYAEVFAAPEELGTSPTQTRNISNDLKLHAPKPSVPASAAKQRVSTVTRTDSGQAAAFGIGKANSDDKDPASRPLKQKASFASQTSNGTERPGSSAGGDSEHGIPEIGQRVPMYPNAGDVQAPSPAPFAQPYAPGIGFHNDGSKPRQHNRRTSAREHEVPLEAYGRHGHQVLPHDRFEKAYYEKRPELFKKELGQYGEGRPEWAMSSEDLNKIVRDTASRGAGLGTSPAVMGTPTEQVGFQASEEYASRISSPRPQSSTYQVAHSNTSQTHVESPLRKESFPADVKGKQEFESTVSGSPHAPSDTALESQESEVEDDDVIHVDPQRRVSRIYGGDGHLDSTEDLGPTAEDGGIHDEHGYSAPILASDEVAKEPFGWELQPAVSPSHERRSGNYEEYGFYNHKSTSQTSLNGSRPSSRPTSIHGNLPGLRLPSDSQKLEDLEEYEPLFPEEEKNATKPLTAADRLKRPELKNRKFPSQDVWEDTPNSLQYTATVSSPQLPEDVEASPVKTNEETAAQAFARKQEELAEKESKSPDSFLYKEKKPWEKNAHLAQDTRPGMKQRFPSRDIWEDTPDSLQLETTVASPQEPEKDTLSPEEARSATEVAPSSKPQIPARPTKSKPTEVIEKSQPAIPERPARKSADTASPPVPVKAKPVVPARPSKPLTRESSENIPLSQVASNSSAKSVGSDQSTAAAAKPKPPVPSRPLGSKIAALQGGFMSDLNKRLQLGPQGPKKEEPTPEQAVVEKEKVPLSDARKGRARGPARRAPAKSPSPGAADAAAASASAAVPKSTLSLSFSLPATVWELDPDEDEVYVISEKEKAEAVSAVPTKAAQLETSTLATKAGGQPVHEVDEIAPEAEKSLSLPSATEDAQKEAIITGSKTTNHQTEQVKNSDEPAVLSKGSLAPEVAEEEDLSGSTATLKASEATGGKEESVE